MYEFGNSELFLFLFIDFLIFIENRLFSHVIYPDYGFPSLYSFQFPTLSLPSTYFPSLSHTRKQTGFYGTIMKYNLIIENEN